MRTLRGVKGWVAALVAAMLPLLTLTPALAQVQMPAPAPAPAAKADRIIEGKILSQEGAAVPNATVRVRNLDTGQEFTSTPAAADGAYKLSKLPPGRYEISVQTEKGVYLGNRTIDLVNKQAVTYSFALKATTPEEAIKQAEAARGEEEERKKAAAAGRPPINPSDTGKTSFWSNPGTAVLVGIAVAVGAAAAIDNLRSDEEASPSSP